MADSVKGIFKTLLAVPCIIAVAYLIFNLFSFAYSYFKLLGLSYVVMETAVENNYIPSSEREMFGKYMASMDTAILDDIQVSINTKASGTSDQTQTLILTDGSGGYGVYNGEHNSRRQYGSEIQVAIKANYHWINPLMPHEQIEGGRVQGIDGTGQTQWKSDAELQQMREESANRDHNITIVYTVPGLKYYPDLSTY